jgi:hypothetical protein
MENIYFRNNFVSIFYNKDLRLGKAIWQGDLIGSEFREAVLLCLDLIDRYALVGWLGDNRRMSFIRPSDLEWSTKVFVPQLLESSLLRLANIPSENEQNREAVEVLYSKVSGNDCGLLVRNFTDEKKAVVWLKELTKKESLL